MNRLMKKLSMSTCAIVAAPILMFGSCSPSGSIAYKWTLIPRGESNTQCLGQRVSNSQLIIANWVITGGCGGGNALRPGKCVQTSKDRTPTAADLVTC